MQIAEKQSKQIPGHRGNGCNRHRSTHQDHLWSYDFLTDRTEAQWVIGRWQNDYNHHRPHSSLNYQNPAAFAEVCPDSIRTDESLETISLRLVQIMGHDHVQASNDNKKRRLFNRRTFWRQSPSRKSIWKQKTRFGF